jgi:hypothetical protein
LPCKGKGKGKVHPRTGHEDPELEKRYRSTISLTSALGGGDTGVDERIILRWIFRKWDVGGMDWIDLAQDRDRLASQEGLCFLE